jgi:hypothetical protein
MGDRAVEAEARDMTTTTTRRLVIVSDGLVGSGRRNGGGSCGGCEYMYVLDWFGRGTESDSYCIHPIQARGFATVFFFKGPKTQVLADEF